MIKPAISLDGESLLSLELLGHADQSWINLQRVSSCGLLHYFKIGNQACPWPAEGEWPLLC